MFLRVRPQLPKYFGENLSQAVLQKFFDDRISPNQPYDDLKNRSQSVSAAGEVFDDRLSQNHGSKIFHAEFFLQSLFFIFLGKFYNPRRG